MQILLIISFALMVLSSLFIGQAMQGGYAPYMSFGAAALYFLALFMPFLSEYNVLHRGFSHIGDNFKNLMGTQEHHKGDVEIILPGDAKSPAEQYDLDTRSNASISVVVLLIIASLLMGYDILDFYILGDHLNSNTGPISNF